VAGARSLFPALAAGAAVVALGAAPVGEGGGAAPRAFVRTTQNFVAALSMDGPVVAYDVIGGFDRAAGKGYCNRMFALNVVTRAAVQVSAAHGRTCDAGTTTGAGVFQVAVAGSRIAWLDNERGTAASADFLVESSVRAPKERTVATAVSRAGAPEPVIRGVVGDRDLLVVSTATVSAKGALVRAALRQVTPSHLGPPLRSGPAAILTEAVDRGRIAVLTPAHRVVLYSDGGGLLRDWSVPSATEVALDGGDVAVLAKGRLEIEDAGSGRLLRTVRVAKTAYSLDVASGIAAYAAGRALHAVLLSTGRDAVVATAPNPIVGAAVEAPGLAYAWGVYASGVHSGRLGFVPHAALLAKLRS